MNNSVPQLGDTRRIHFFLSGEVQGVFFRDTAETKAYEIGGLTGWICNLPDGRVEAVVEGGLEPLDKFMTWCKKGPDAAKVDKVEMAYEKPTGEFDTFQMKIF